MSTLFMIISEHIDALISGVLAVCKKNSQFLCNDEQPTFLVGANQAWFNYVTGDFGNRLYFTISMIPLQTYLTTLKAAGGNSISMKLNYKKDSWNPKTEGRCLLYWEIHVILKWRNRKALIFSHRLCIKNTESHGKNLIL